jgi:hypothetical protein
MQISPSVINLAKALIQFHVKVGKIKKDSNNPFFGKKYASLSNILENCNDALNESGLAVTQFPSGENGLSTILIHAESGEFIESEYIMRPVKDDPQGRGSAMTYMRRYALAAVLALVIDEDDDANAASGKTPAHINGVALEQPPVAGIELPWLNENTKEFKGAVEKLKAGTTTLDGIRKVRRVSKAIETKLLEASKN